MQQTEIPLNHMKYALDSLCMDDCYNVTSKDVIGMHYPVVDRRIVKSIKPRGVAVDFRLEDPADKSSGALFTVNNNPPQYVPFIERPCTFGPWYKMQCECGREVVKLYLKPGGHRFVCNECTNLATRSQILCRNPKSKNGGSLKRRLYILRKLDHLALRRESLTGRMFRNGKPTRKFKSFLREAKRAGLDDLVESFEALAAMKV